MNRKDTIEMRLEELKRVSIVNQVIGRTKTQVEAAKIIGISPRQVRRLIKRVREEGDTGIIHRSRGKPGHGRINDKIRAKVIELYNEKYWDFGPTLASEKLYEVDGIAISHETLRLWLIAGSKRDWQRKGRPHRQWRQRKDYFGEMVQMDGSHHDWLEERGPKLVFMGYIDDATGTTFGRFYDYEGTMPAMDSLSRYTEIYGIPHSIYLDRHSTYKATKKQTIEEQLKNEMPMSQFEKAAKELGITILHAHSAPAKGRIERGFGTHQDRLVKEMRLAGIKTKDEANEFLKDYLPKHNQKFSIPPAKEENLHRKSPGKKELEKILCMQTERYLGNDAVIRHNNKFYQVEGIRLRRRIKRVIVEDRLDGSMHVRNNGTYFKYVEIDPGLIRRSGIPKKITDRPRRVYIPPKDHPWRHFKIKTYPYVDGCQQEEQNTKEKELLLTKL